MEFCCTGQPYLQARGAGTTSPTRGVISHMRSSEIRAVQAHQALVAIKVLHTAVWVLLAGSILALPITAVLQRFNWAVIVTVITLAECGVLAFNKGRCPLTDWAARFTG